MSANRASKSADACSWRESMGFNALWPPMMKVVQAPGPLDDSSQHRTERRRPFVGAHRRPVVDHSGPARRSDRSTSKASLRQTKRHDFPDRRFASDAWTHDLQKLIVLAGVWPDFEAASNANRALQLNWSLIKDWSEAVRYDPTITRTEAREYYSACTAKNDGILPWIRRRW